MVMSCGGAYITKISIAFVEIDHNPRTVQLVKAGSKLYQRHDNGQIWKFNDSLSAPYWSIISGNDNLLAIAGCPKHLYKLHTNGELLRLNESSGGFEVIQKLYNVKDVIASDKNFYYILASQSDPGIGMANIDEPSPSYAELQELYNESQANLVAALAENIRLKGSS